MGGSGTAAVELLNSHNNTITQNSLRGTGCYGIILTGSGYNKIEKNSIVSTSPDRAGIQLESTGCEYNYIYENNITAEAYGIYLQTGAEHNVFFKNTVYNCKDSLMMSGSMFNDFLGNTFSGASRYAVYLGGSDGNNFVWNSFDDNTGVFEAHEMYWMSFINGSYYAEYTTWDDGKEGNYWSDYTGQDSNGDGIGDTPYRVYENFTDSYPLTEPYDTSKIYVDFKEWVNQASIDLQLPTETPQIISPPENNESSDSFPLVPAVVSVGAACVLVSAVFCGM
jgi:parallel beta-helix repeat protein